MRLAEAALDRDRGDEREDPDRGGDEDEDLAEHEHKGVDAGAARDRRPKQQHRQRKRRREEQRQRGRLDGPPEAVGGDPPNPGSGLDEPPTRSGSKRDGEPDRKAAKHPPCRMRVLRLADRPPAPVRDVSRDGPSEGGDRGDRAGADHRPSAQAQQVLQEEQPEPLDRVGEGGDALGLLVHRAELLADLRHQRSHEQIAAGLEQRDDRGLGGGRIRDRFRGLGHPLGGLGAGRLERGELLPEFDLEQIEREGVASDPIEFAIECRDLADGGDLLAEALPDRARSAEHQLLHLDGQQPLERVGPSEELSGPIDPLRRARPQSVRLFDEVAILRRGRFDRGRSLPERGERRIGL